MIIRFGECGPYGLGRKTCYWFTDISSAIDFSKTSDKPIFIKIGNKPYKEISKIDLSNYDK